MLRLEYKPTPRSRTWRRSSLSMYPQAMENMKRSAIAIAEQEGWHAFRIVADI